MLYATEETLKYLKCANLNLGCFLSYIMFLVYYCHKYSFLLRLIYEIDKMENILSFFVVNSFWEENLFLYNIFQF